MNSHICVEVLAIIPDAIKLEPLRVPEEPGGFVVTGGIVHRCNVECYLKCLAMAAHGAAGRGLSH